MQLDEALKLLRGGPSGVVEWNRRREAGESVPSLQGVSLALADMAEADLRGVDLRSAILDDANMYKARLEGADLRHATLIGTKLQSVRLDHAKLSSARFLNAYLGGADVSRVDVANADFKNAIFDRAKASLPQLKQFLRQGAVLWPEQIEAALAEDEEGLTFYFDARITRWDRHVLEGFILAVLGTFTDCRVTMFREVGNGAVVRLVASRQEDLELVAEALWHRIWESSEQIHADSLLTLRSLLASTLTDRALATLSEMRAQLDRIELRQRSDAVIESEERRAQAEGAAELARVVHSWRGTDQKAVDAAAVVAVAIADCLTQGGASATLTTVRKVSRTVGDD